ncbi:PilZ domain-containing protein [Peribacillus kribbensis]|uniref:PilZ domain-containing protein n=1 Tax=Peribacillus kribbensis TaxID=356658 RepID=UPI00040D88B1|nr:PilZ domain-containing protein [Peribacillus kribbensis]
MIYKREESFRFSLKVPVTGEFAIISRKGAAHQDKYGALEILDISPNGLKFSSTLNLPLDENIQILVHFTLNSTLLELPGSIVWKKIHLGRWHYGFMVQGPESLKEKIRQQIISELKLYIKK